MITSSILAFAVTIGVLVTFHEFGHFLVARLCDVKVLRFSVGFGKVIYSRRFGKGETEWALSAIPLGGYVKMLDEREGEVAAHELARAFNRKPVLQRMAIVVAGPMFNLLLAVILYFALFSYGYTDLKPGLGEVPAETPAAQAQLQAHETVLRIDGVPIQSWGELQWRMLMLALHGGKVQVDGRLPDGVEQHHMLDLSSIRPSDLNGPFMQKLGLLPDLPPLPALIGKLVPGDVAEKAGLQSGDRVLRIDGREIASFDEWAAVVRAHPRQPLHLDLERGGRPLAMDITPREETENGKVIGRVGAYPQVDPQADRQAMGPFLTQVRYAPLAALGQGMQRTWDIGALSLEMLGRMVLGQVSVRNLSGPIGTAKAAGMTADLGVEPFIMFLALISVSVGVLNLLPIPILDGGHLLYYMAEFFMGRPVPERAWETGQKIGAVVLIALMILVFYNDISRLISG